MSRTSCRPQYQLPVAPVIPLEASNDVPSTNGRAIGPDTRRDAICQRATRPSAAIRSVELSGWFQTKLRSSDNAMSGSEGRQDQARHGGDRRGQDEVQTSESRLL